MNTLIGFNNNKGLLKKNFQAHACAKTTLFSTRYLNKLFFSMYPKPPLPILLTIEEKAFFLNLQ